ncbi:LysR family transcriptional regulator [Marinobacteraceae bacterium S3BR75-40.1]
MIEPTLEQWRTLIAIADHGTYAAAAEHLDKSTSTLTYAIQKLEQALEVKLLEKRGRRAVLTDAGTVLVRRARNVLTEADTLGRLAHSLGAGQEAELRLTTEIIFPTCYTLAALGALNEAYPDTRVELYEHVLSGTEDMLVRRDVDLAITSHVPPGFLGEPILRMTMLPVASPDHPLHHLGRPVTEQDLNHYRQLVIRDSGLYRRRTTLRIDARYRTTVTQLTTSIQALEAGHGFAWMPQMLVQEALDHGRLQPLPTRAPSERFAELFLVFADRDLAGPATRFLAERLMHEARCAMLA